MKGTKDEEYWADWLVDAVATATQDRRFLRGDPDCDEDLCEVLLANGRRAIRNACLEISFDAYQAEASRTAGPLDDKPKALASFGLGAAGETGEAVSLVLGAAVAAGLVADRVKKHVGHGHDLDKDKLTLELGDVLWYVAMLAETIGVPLSEVACRNVEKLRKRYPDGFDPERSKNRGGT